MAVTAVFTAYSTAWVGHSCQAPRLETVVGGSFDSGEETVADLRLGGPLYKFGWLHSQIQAESVFEVMWWCPLSACLP